MTGMTNEELKEEIECFVMDQDELDHIIVLEGDEFADGCIGITDDNHLVYSYDRLVDSLAEAYEKNGMEDPYVAAMEFIDYNTIRSLPYMRSEGYEPIIIHEF